MEIKTTATLCVRPSKANADDDRYMYYFKLIRSGLMSSEIGASQGTWDMGYPTPSYWGKRD